MEELRQQWGRNVAQGRRALSALLGDDITQVRLAEMCRVTQQTISSIERGESAPRDELKLRLAEVLHQDVRQLFPLTRQNVA